MKLSKYKLGDIANIIGGVAYQPSDICDYGIRVLRGGNINSQSITLKNDDVFLPLSYENQDNQIRLGDTILVASTGSVDVLGKAATCFEEIPYTQIGAFLRIIRPKEQRFAMMISIALNSEYFSKYIKSQAKGTSINNITIDYLKEFEIYCPNNYLPICDFYASLENKILLNRKINHNLEAMAKLLYDYWFVQFDFPDENGRPYKSSGGKMVWNEKLKREIPQGWEPISINEVCTSCRGISYRKEDLVSENDGVLVLRGNNIENSRIIFDSNVAYIPKSFVSNEQKIFEGDIIITMSSGSKAHVGKCAMFHKDSKHTFGAFLSKFTPQRNMRHIVFLFLSSEYFKNIIEAYCNGTGINNLTNQTFDNIFLLKPTLNITQHFENIVANMFASIGNLEEESLSLIKQRNELIQLLMNGQVLVNFD
jgi:type I restriction enzyme S subunit